jgi:multiple sugar transport system permease protein
MERRAVLKKYLAYVFVALILVGLYFPIYWLITMSFKTRIDIMTIPPRWFFKPTIANFSWLMHHYSLQSAVVNSIVVALSATFIALALGIPCAFALARFRFPRKQDIEFWVATTRMLPPVAVIIPFYFIWMRLRLLDTRTSLVITYLVINLPLIIWIMMGFFRALPKELEEAARVDGATRWGSFFRVTLPLALPGIGASSILSFIFNWNEFFFTFVLTTTNRTLPVEVASFMAVGLEVKYGEMAAAGVLASIPSLVFAILARRLIVTGFRGIAGFGMK